MTKNRFLKKLLATTAVVGTLAAGAMEAQATGIVRPSTGNTGLATATSALDRTQVAGAPNGAIANADFAVYGGGAYPAAYAAAPVQGIRFDAVRTVAADLINANIGFVDTSAFAGGVWTVTQNFYLGSIGDNGTNHAASAAINVATGRGFTLTGRGATATENTDNGGAVGAGAIAANRYVSATGVGLLGPVVLTGTGFVTVNALNNAVTVINDTIAGNAGNNGILNVTTSGTFNNTIGGGGNYLRTINVGAGATATFNNATAAAALNFTSAATDASSMVFNTTTVAIDLTAGAGAGAIVVTGGVNTGAVVVSGTRAFTAGAVGAAPAGQRVLTVADTRNGAAVASTYGAIFSVNDVTIDHSGGAASLAIILAGADSSAGSIVVKNNAGNITLGGAFAAKNAVTIIGTGASQIVGGNNNITATTGDIVVTSGTGGIAALGALTALAGNTKLTAGNAAGFTATVVKTGTLTFDATATGKAANATFQFGGANTALSADTGLVLKSDSTNTKGIDLTIVNGATQYIGDINLVGATKLSTIDFTNTGSNAVYIGDVGSADARFLSAKLSAAGNGIVPIVDGSDVYINTFTAYNGLSTLILGNGATIYGDIASNAAAGNGILQLQSVPVKTVDATGAVIITPLGNTVVDASITGNVGLGNAIANIDFSRAAAGSSLTVGADVAAANDVTIATKAVTFSATAGAVGTLQMTGGKNHILNLTGGNIAAANIAQGAISSDTANKFTITGGNIGAIGGGAPWTQNSIQSISAGNAANVVFSNGDIYTQALVMKAGSTLTLGDNAGGRTYLIGSLTDGVKITTDVAANNITTFASGTDLGNFASLVLANAGGSITFNDVKLSGANIDSAAAKSGTFTFAGTSVVTSAIGANGGVNTVLVAPAAANIAPNSAVTFNGNINSETGVTVNATNAAAVVKIAGNITGSTPANAGVTRVDANANTATVYFVNAANKPITISGDIAKTGGNSNFTAVNVGAGQVTVQNAKTVATNAITFTDNGNLILQNTGANVLNGIAITATVAKAGTLTTDTDITRAADIGTAALPVGAIAFSADKKFTTTANVYADLQTSAQATSTAAFNFAGGVNAADARTIQNVGTATNQFRTANIVFTAAGTATAGVINAVNSSLDTNNGAGGSTLNFLGSTGTLNLTNVTASDTLNLLDGGSIGAITTATAGKGIVNIKGNGTIAGTLGANNALEAVNIQGGSAAKVVKLSADIYGPVAHDASTLQLTTNSTINGTYVATNSTIALADYLLRVNGAGTFNGNIFISANLNQDVNNSDKSIGGQISLQNLTLTNATALNVKTTVKYDTRIALPTDNTKWSVLAVDNALSAADATKLLSILNLEVVSGNRFLNLTKSSDNKGVYVLTKRDFSALVNEVTAANDATGRASALAAQILANQGSLSGSALSAFTDWGYLDDATEASNRLTSTPETPQVAGLAATNIMSAVSARATSVGSSPVGVIADLGNDLGASAGDEATKMGAWISGFAGTGNQGARKGTSGFKAKTYGGVVGFDTAFNDAMVVGVAAGMADVKVKYKNSKSGDKTTAKTYVFSVYGTYDFGNSWVGQASAMLGNGTVKNNALRVTSAGYQTATGKFDTVTGGGELLGGYKFVVSETSSVTPLAGLGYTRTSENGYTETGTTAQNLKISERSSDKLEGILGLRASTQIEADGMIVTPEAHGFMNYDFKAKAPKATATLDGLNGALPSGVAKPARASYNLGAGVMITSDMVQYGVSYDSQISDKYFGHQGTLKVRVSF